MSDELQHSLDQLRERIKEFEFIHAMTCMAASSDAELDHVVQAIADLIPSAFLHPESTCARVTIGPVGVRTANFTPCAWKVETPITAGGEVIGAIEVGYLGMPPHGDPPFLDEERKLVQVIAACIGMMARAKILRDTLTRSETMFRAVVENSLVGIARTTLRGEILYANGTCLRIFGYETMEEARAAGSFRIYSNPETRKTFMAMLKRTGSVSGFEAECMKKSGESVIILFSAVLEGDVVTGMMMDITDRKRIEESLVTSERRLNEAQRVAHVGNWEWDLDTGKLYCSDEAYRIFGLAPRQVDATFVAFLDMVHPGDRRKIEQATEDLLNGRRTDERLEPRIVLPDGRERTVFLRGRVIFSEDGRPVRIVGAVHDITEQKRAKDALIRSERRLIEAQRIGNVGNWDLDILTGELHWSDQVYRIFGLQPQQFAATYEAFLARVHPEDRQALRDTVDRSLAHPPIPYSFEHRVILSDGRERTVQERGEVTFDADSRPVRMMGTVHDVTDRKLAENEIRSLKDRLEAENIYLRDEIEAKESYGDIIGLSDALQATIRRVGKVARTKTTVLLTGETGTGKGIFARYLHRMSDRRDNPFVNVNCAGLPANLIESELFGREKGAFTGSTVRQIGRFELADGGTIFLDEIGELPIELQAKLLKVIESGEFERLGSPHPVNVDVRIVASTNRNLEEEIKRGRFRQDLYFRLNVFPVSIPPLRDRKGDVPLLVQAYAAKFAKDHKKDIVTIRAGTMQVLENYSWPGNVRELINVIERAVIVSDGPALQLAEMESFSGRSLPHEDNVDTWDGFDGKELHEVEKRHILRTLHATGWRVSGPRGAAYALGINPSTLRTRMKKLNIARPEW